MIQLAWRFLMFQRESALARWYRQRVAAARGSGNKQFIVALSGAQPFDQGHSIAVNTVVIIDQHPGYLPAYASSNERDVAIHVCSIRRNRAES
jgi:hypothetical protein